MATPTDHHHHNVTFELPLLQQQPHFSQATQAQLYQEMNHSVGTMHAMALEYYRLVSSSPTAGKEGEVEAQSKELHNIMIKLGDHIVRVTHDLHFYDYHRRAPVDQESHARPQQKACAHCGATSSSAWRRGPGYLLLCNGCGLRYAQACKRERRSMSVQSMLN